MHVAVTDLVGRPGATRAVERAVDAGAFGDDPWGHADDALVGPIELSLHLDAVVEGILVRGRVRFALELPCARCLEPQPIEREVDVAELFIDPERREPGYDDDDADPGYELIDDATALDLTTLVRDALLVDLPVRIICQDDCKGLCATCGSDRNRTDCGHEHEQIVDSRWSVLADIDVPADGH